MDHLHTGEPVWSLTFDDKGRLTAPDEAQVLAEVAGEGVADLFVFSHGWGTSQGGAQSLYDAMFPLIRNAATGLPGLGSVGFVGIFWPSLWFPPTQATPATAAGSTQADAGAALDLDAGTSALSGAEIADSLRPGFADPDQADTITRIGRLIDEGEASIGSGEPDEVKQQRLLDLQEALSSLLPPAPDGEFEDSGETALLLAPDPVAAYRGAAEAFGSAPPGSSTQAVGDWFARAINGVKDATRVFSYTVMKARAGDIGRGGLGPVLQALHERSSTIRVHLIGHSFGARLVSFALAGISSADASPVASLLLLQGAFSHWSFAHAQDNPFGSPGALNGVADRVHGPLVATFTPFDWAVGVWYPRASFMARQDQSAAVAGRWGAMGSDGFQAVAPFAGLTMPAAGGTDYSFDPGAFHGVDASDVINDVVGQSFAGAHSDIRKPAVAELAAAAAAAHA